MYMFGVQNYHILCPSTGSLLGCPLFTCVFHPLVDLTRPLGAESPAPPLSAAPGMVGLPQLHQMLRCNTQGGGQDYIPLERSVVLGGS